MRFKDITGQHEVKKRLLHTVRESRISHAQLFTGPAGVGKLATAIAYGQYINCRNKQDDDSCGTCPSCLKYEKLVHPDLHFSFPVAGREKNKVLTCRNFMSQWREYLAEASFYPSLDQWYEKVDFEKKHAIINSEECNEIIKNTNVKSFEAPYKVIILWMVEKLYHAAAPKLLKILEEPPEKTLFILISENPDQVIKTILSRTQLVKFRAIDEEILKNSIVDNYDLEEEEAARIARHAEGNMNEAAKLIKKTGSLEEFFSTFVEWMRLGYKPSPEELFNFAAKMGRNSRSKNKSFLLYSLAQVQKSYLLGFFPEKVSAYKDEEYSFYKKFSPFINADNIEQFHRELNDAIYHIERNAKPEFLFFDLALKFNKLMSSKGAKAI